MGIAKVNPESLENTEFSGVDYDVRLLFKSKWNNIENSDFLFYSLVLCYRIAVKKFIVVGLLYVENQI